MSTAEARSAGSTEQGPLLQVENLAKRYRSRRALEGLSLTVRSGEIVGLVGANGSGKTTSLRILAGLLAPDAGRGSVLGFDLLRNAREIRRQHWCTPRDSCCSMSRRLDSTPRPVRLSGDTWHG